MRTIVRAGLWRVGAQRQKQEGQALVEMSICALLFVVLMLGLVDFAWDFLQLHMVTQATSVAARAASALSHPCGDNAAQLALAQQMVTGQTTGFATVDPSSGVTVTLTNETKGATPCVPAGKKAQVTVQVTGRINDVFAMVLHTKTLNFTRTETFLDEGQS